MKFSISPSLKRSLGYSALTLCVLVVFLLGYFYYFIPINRESLHRNGFLILRGIAENIQYRNASHLNLFANFYKNTSNQDTVRKFLEQNNIQATPVLKNAGNMNMLMPGSKFSSKNDQGSYERMEIEKRNLKFSIHEKGRPDTLIVYESLRDFLEPMLISQRSELFKSYALVNISGKDSKLLFQDADLGMRSDFFIDSLLPRNMTSYVSGVRDFNTPEFDHLMFYYPFEINEQQLVLCGFIKTEKYNAHLRNMPFYFLYPLVIIFLLLLFFMPILKFYIMDSNERLGTRGLAMFGLSVFGSATLITLVLIHFLLWKGDEMRARNNLHALSNEIESRFLKELENTYDQLHILDSIRRLDPDGALLPGQNVDYSDKLVELLRNYNTGQGHDVMRGMSRDSVEGIVQAVAHSRRLLYPFERISWIDPSGMQRIKADIYGKPVFTDVSDRNYFQALQNDEAFLIPGTSKEFSWEPLYSWTNASFNITISRKADSLVAALATNMHSVYRVLMPVGYGFCLIDKDGKVQLHSDINRNLRENLFEKADQPERLKGMVAARKEWDFNDVMIYGNRHLMHIHPVKQLPYYLVTFYDKGYIVPVNMRILIFALLCCVFSTVTCVLLWVALGRIGFGGHAFVYSSMDSMSWLQPKKEETGYYSHASVFLMGYVVLLLLLVFLHKPANVSGFTVFSIVALTPLNVVLVLFIMRTSLLNAAANPHAGGRWKIRPNLLLVAIVHLLISIFFYVYSRKAGYPVHGVFILFQAVIAGWMWLYLLAKRSAALMSRKFAFSYLTNYSWMATWLVICIAVIPSALYTWYAHNHEIPQAIRKQQLHLFNGINKRSGEIISKTKSGGMALLPDTAVSRLIYKEGIYTLYKDSVYVGTAGGRRTGKPVMSDPFYFTIAESVSNRYYDPELYPALEDASADNTWSWEEKDDKLHFSYFPPQAKSARENQSVHIVSALPSRFVFLTSWSKAFWLLVLVGFLVWALYQWLRINTSNVFLVKYVQKDSPPDDPGTLISEYYTAHPEMADTAGNAVVSEKGYEKYAYTTNRAALDLYEKEILEQVRSRKSFYEFVWDKLIKKERYLLLDFAQDGLLNYKNPLEIYGLISKGVLRVKNKKMRLFEPGFRAFILTKRDTPEVQELHTLFQHNSAWRAARGPLLLLGLGFLTLIFFTQEDMFQKILGLATGAATLMSIIPKLFLSSNKAPDISAG
jgi:hypothetical protein